MFQACSQHPAFAARDGREAHASAGTDQFRIRREHSSRDYVMSQRVSPSAAEVPGAAQSSPDEDWSGQRSFASEVEGLYRSRARALAARLRRDGAGQDGIDYIHEAFERILRRNKCRGEVPERPEAYIARTSRNLLYDEGRANLARDRWSQQAAANGADHHDPIVYLESRDALRRLEAGLMKLRPITRQVFLARRVEGLGYAEIAEVTGLSVRAVEKQMSKAIAKLSRLMDRG
jgi:RNA polymerase sigma-70 factor (ECF subfamily)